MWKAEISELKYVRTKWVKQNSGVAFESTGKIRQQQNKPIEHTVFPSYAKITELSYQYFIAKQKLSYPNFKMEYSVNIQIFYSNFWSELNSFNFNLYILIHEAYVPRKSCRIKVDTWNMWLLFENSID